MKEKRSEKRKKITIIIEELMLKHEILFEQTILCRNIYVYQ